MLERPEQRTERLLAPHRVRGGIVGPRAGRSVEESALDVGQRLVQALAAEPSVGLLPSRLPLPDPQGIAVRVRDHVLDVPAPHQRVEDERAVGDLDGGRPRAGHHISRRPSRAWASVTSSAYSRSPPTGRPLASRVTRTPDRLQQRGDVHRGRVALQVRVRRQDDLGDVVALDAVEQLLDAQVVGADAVERADRATQDVVAALDQRRLLDRRRVLRLLHDAEHGGDRATASRHTRQRSPSATLPHSRQNAIRSLACDDRGGEPLGVLGGRLHQPERQPLRRLRVRCRGAAPARRSAPGSGLRTPRLVPGSDARRHLRAEHLLYPAKASSSDGGSSSSTISSNVGSTDVPRLAHDAHDRGADAEQISSSAACSSAVLRHDLLDRERLRRRERQLQRLAVVRRHGGRLERRLQDHLPLSTAGAPSATATTAGASPRPRAPRRPHATCVCTPLGTPGSAATVGARSGRLLRLLAASRLRCSGSPLRAAPPSAAAASACRLRYFDGGRCVGKRRP